MEKYTFIFCFGLILHMHLDLSISETAQIIDNELFYKNFENFSLSDTYSEEIISDPLYQNVDLEMDKNKFYKRRELVDSGLSNETKLKILELHNLYRSNVTPPAGNMAFMEWDERLEHLAQLWANNCVFDHGKPKNTTYPGAYGQNLYIGTDPTGLLGVWMWYEEYLDYDFHNMTCPSDKKCGHYVTMAWAESNKLGCAMASCGFRYYLVCHYSPAALRGMHIYDVSKPCSQCPTKPGTLCYENLCITREQCERNPDKCKLAKCNVKCHNCGWLNETECHCNCADGWDSYDCSRICIDSHERCGKKPGFPNKATCSLNRYAVGNVHCRQMCEKCYPFVENTKINHICCDGKLCPEGYVFDQDRNPCRCTLLCPGPRCDLLEGSGLKTRSIFHLLLVTCLLSYFIQKFLLK